MQIFFSGVSWHNLSSSPMGLPTLESIEDLSFRLQMKVTLFIAKSLFYSSEQTYQFLEIFEEEKILEMTAMPILM